MDKEEILYNEIYDRTKDFGRTQFVREIMRLQRECKQLQKIEEEHQKINGELRVENKELKDRIDKANWWLEEMLKQAKNDETKAIIYGTLDLLLKEIKNE